MPASQLIPHPSTFIIDAFVELTFDSFFTEVKRIATPDYIPNEDDVLRARVKTTGISETRFSMGELQ